MKFTQYFCVSLVILCASADEKTARGLTSSQGYSGKMDQLNQKLTSIQAGTTSNANAITTYNTQLATLINSMNTATANANKATTDVAATTAKLNNYFATIKQPFNDFLTALAVNAPSLVATANALKAGLAPF